jgi:uncharacterized protein (DUF2235 family)
MAKNVVVCLDGTGNQVKARGSTNVVRLYELLDLRDPGRQVAYYDPGVGTFSAAGAWTPAARTLSRGLGLALGTGMRQNLAEAYRYLMETWEPGDPLYVFGFSRGAYTARALAGMLYRVGLLRPGAENLVPYAVGVYARNRGEDADLSGDEGWDRIDRFSAAFARTTRNRSRAVPITFLGAWDTVKAAGILNWDLTWPYTRQLRTWRPCGTRCRSTRSADPTDRTSSGRRRTYQCSTRPGSPECTPTSAARSRTTRGWPTSHSSGWSTARWPPVCTYGTGPIRRDAP